MVDIRLQESLGNVILSNMQSFLNTKDVKESNRLRSYSRSIGLLIGRLTLTRSIEHQPDPVLPREFEVIHVEQEPDLRPLVLRVSERIPLACIVGYYYHAL